MTYTPGTLYLAAAWQTQHDAISHATTMDNDRVYLVDELLDSIHNKLVVLNSQT